MTQNNLLVVAHPDDETIFFSGLLSNLKDFPWTVVCVTWDGVPKRKTAFAKACAQLGAEEFFHWDFKDNIRIRLPVADIVKELKALPLPAAVYTHSIGGDYGHPHHQDVSKAVHEAFLGHDQVYSVAYTAPEVKFHLTEEQANLRFNVLTKTYGLPMNFLRAPPSARYDAFARLAYDPSAIYPLRRR